jgi:hypothetical protein
MKMKTIQITTLLIITLLLSPLANGEYPPKNAAVIYYKNMYHYPPQDGSADKLKDIADDIELTEDIIEHVNSYHYVVRDLVTAAKIDYCDWGIDYSQGFDTLLPGLSSFKRYARLLLADTKIHASKGNYVLALDRCITMQKSASHISDETIISALVALSINAMADKGITHILGEMPADKTTLLKLKRQLDTAEDRIAMVKASFYGEKMYMMLPHLDKDSPARLTPEMVKEFVGKDFPADDPMAKELLSRLDAGDEQIYKDIKQYWFNVMDAQIAAFDLPYTKAYNKLNKEIPDKVTGDAKKKPEAFMAQYFVPAYGKVYALAVRSQASLNSLRAAVDVYLVKATTGKLPAKLSPASPKDIFSNKPFIYEKTEEGFILRCRGKDLNKNVTHEYTFKVKK